MTKYPRTMKEAFGPYTNDELEGPRAPRLSRLDRISLLVSCLVGIGLLATCRS